MLISVINHFDLQKFNQSSDFRQIKSIWLVSTVILAAANLAIIIDQLSTTLVSMSNPTSMAVGSQCNNIQASSYAIVLIGTGRCRRIIFTLLSFIFVKLWMIHFFVTISVFQTEKIRLKHEIKTTELYPEHTYNTINSKSIYHTLFFVAGNVLLLAPFVLMLQRNWIIDGIHPIAYVGVLFEMTLLYLLINIRGKVQFFIVAILYSMTSAISMIVFTPLIFGGS